MKQRRTHKVHLSNEDRKKRGGYGKVKLEERSSRVNSRVEVKKLLYSDEESERAK